MKIFLKKTIRLVVFLIGFSVFAQVPQKMTYQSVIRNTTGDLVTNATIGVQISILQGSPTGQAVYVETMNNTTNENGLLTLEIGGGTPVTGTFAGINWATGTYFVKTETDPTGGTNYSIVGVGQLLSVPYALFSGKSTNLGKSTIYLTDDITDAEAAAQIEEEAGPNTENIIIEGTTLLTTIDLSKIKSLLIISITGNQNLTSINFDNLKKIYKDVHIDGNPLLTSLSFPILEKSTSGIFSITYNESLTSIEFPNLTNLFTAEISANSNLSAINFNSLINSYAGISIANNNLASIAFPLLTNCYLNISENHLTSIDLPSFTNGTINFNCPLTTLNAPLISNCSISIFNSQLTSLNFQNLLSSIGVDLRFNNSLTEASFPNLTNVEGYFVIASNTVLNSISIPSLNVINPNNSNYSYYFYTKSNALPQSQINYLLNKLTSVNNNPGMEIHLEEQNPPAPPTGQGLIDKQTLLTNGFNVITD